MKYLNKILFGTLIIFMAVELGAPAKSIASKEDTYLSFLSLLLSKDTYREYADRYVAKESIDENNISVTAYKENSLITGVVLETSNGTYKISATFIEQTGYTRIATIVDDGEKNFSIIFFTPTDLLHTLKENLNRATNASMREQFLKDFLKKNGFSLYFNVETDSLVITINKNLISTLSSTTYKVKYDNISIPTHSLQVIDDDPVIGWYFNYSENPFPIEYELPGTNEGEIIVTTEEPILINDGNLTVSYRKTACLSGEAFLFDLDDLYESKIYGTLANKFYHVCVAHSASDLVAGTGTTLFSYDSAYGNYYSGSTGENVVRLGSQNDNYQISVKESATNPDQAIYSCIGSYNNLSKLFGDCGYVATNRIWIGAVPANEVEIYNEDFSTDPNFTSLAPTYAYWNSTAGYYYVNTRDDLNHKYWAYSPDLGLIDTSKPTSIELDVMFEYQDWGTYPGVRFYSEEPTEINAQHSFRVYNAYADGVYKKIGIVDVTGSNSNLTPTISDDVWYHVSIKLNGDTTANIQVTNKSNGSVIFSKDNTPFSPDSFRYIGVGYYDQPNYGDSWSPIRLDNIRITQ